MSRSGNDTFTDYVIRPYKCYVTAKRACANLYFLPKMYFTIWTKEIIQSVKILPRTELFPAHPLA